MVFKGVFFLFSMDFKWAIEQLRKGKKVYLRGCLWFLASDNGFVKPYALPEKISLERTGINLNALAGDSWELFESSLSDKVQNVQLNTGDGFFKLISVDDIKDAFTEMESNAIDVCPDGGEVKCVPLKRIKEIFGKELI